MNYKEAKELIRRFIMVFKRIKDESCLDETKKGFQFGSNEYFEVLDYTDESFDLDSYETRREGLDNGIVKYYKQQTQISEYLLDYYHNRALYQNEDITLFFVYENVIFWYELSWDFENKGYFSRLSLLNKTEKGLPFRSSPYIVNAETIRKIKEYDSKREIERMQWERSLQ